jgi:thiosulfate/3-mercaptopyruvate sulfurtransferase
MYQTLISANELNQSLKEIVILDCRFYLNDVRRGRKEYIQSHIPGAVYLDIEHDLSGPVTRGMTGRHPLPHPELVSNAFVNAGINNNSQVVAYDQSNGAYASRAWWLLRWLGHENVAVLDGGIKEWITLHFPLDNQWTLPTPGNFMPRIQTNFTLSMNDIEKNKDPLIDSREPKRYSGEYEPIDPVAGHIPGAICIPYMDNTSESGKWKTVEELKQRFSGIESTFQEPPVFYCGSGVTACHNILAYKIATGRDARLYPGSWSEWINYHH